MQIVLNFCKKVELKKNLRTFEAQQIYKKNLFVISYGKNSFIDEYMRSFPSICRHSSQDNFDDIKACLIMLLHHH